MQWFLVLAMLGGIIQAIREEKPEYLFIVGILGVVAYAIHIARKREVERHAKTVAVELHNLAKNEMGENVPVPVPIPVPVPVPVPLKSSLLGVHAASALSYDTCRVCGSQNQRGWRFCSNCSAPYTPPPMPTQCPQCNHQNLDGWKFCSECGAARR